MDGEQWIVTDRKTLEAFITHAVDLLEKNGSVTFKWQAGDQRTRRQNNAMWLWLDRLATALNDAGYDMKKTLKPHIEIPWNKERAKAHLWNPIQDIITGKDSSRRLSKEQVDQIQETLSRHLAQTTGVHVPFPTIERQPQWQENPRRPGN